MQQFFWTGQILPHSAVAFKKMMIHILSHSFNNDGVCRAALGLLIISVDLMVRQLEVLCDNNNVECRQW